MSVEIKVPALPESVADAVIANWYKQVGEQIAADEVLVDLETDKVVLEVPSMKAGVIEAIHFQVGDTVTAGQLLATVNENGSASAAGKGGNGSDAEAAGESVATNSAATNSAAGESAKRDSAGNTGAPVQMSPSVRKLIAENGLDPADIKGTGKNGRIIRSDVEAFMAQPKDDTHTQASATPGQSPTSATAISGERLERRVAMTRLRARIAERLTQSQQEAAILTTFNEVNMKPVMVIRKKYKDAFEKKYGVRLGFMSFFVQACVEALKQFPEVNASIDGNDIVYHGYYDVGVAVSGPNGLVVPVLRDADIMSIADIEQAIIQYAEKARSNALSIEDITGGTFTISNGGVFGSMLSTPIINPPQSAILGMHSITERAMVVDGEVVVLPMMYLALSYDHRLIDGKSAVQFLVTVKQLLEDPSRMLLGV